MAWRDLNEERKNIPISYETFKNKLLKHFLEKTNELRRFKQIHPSQMDVMNPDTGEVEEYGYDKAEQQRVTLLEKVGNEFHTIWSKEGLE